MRITPLFLSFALAATPAFAAGYPPASKPGAPSAPAAATPAPAPDSAAAPTPAATVAADSETTAETPKSDGAKKAKKVEVKMVDGMQFDPPRFESKPGEELEIDLENDDSTHQPHNFLVIKPGTREEIVKQSLELGEKGPAQDFIPVNPAIVAHSQLLNADGTFKLKFTMPAEKGIYPFVCSMPGHGMLMYGAIYSGVPMPHRIAEDKNIPPMATQAATPGNGKRPYVQRIFMPHSGPASIAVTLPGNLNYCWDAGECRLRYVWRGPFIDASANWRGNGKDLPAMAAEPWWVSEKGKLPFDLGTVQSVKFLGYKLEGGLPEFHYRLGNTEVFEKITPAPNDTGVVLHFRIPKAAKPVQFSLGSSTSNPSFLPRPSGSTAAIAMVTTPAAKITSVAGGTSTDVSAKPLHLTPAQAADFTVTLADPNPAAPTASTH